MTPALFALTPLVEVVDNRGNIIREVTENLNEHYRYYQPWAGRWLSVVPYGESKKSRF
ncbi:MULTISPECIES: hypothetical protein [Providencia]|jgi:hypothetical protein|uniref:hypothetical protein n=1 Tax=Providencia TaxID=586 RepID=UPI00235FC826|nr:hypothetical protein [Providencia rettgeri]MDR2224364.1 hypothetical protein [Providencia sp.]